MDAIEGTGRTMLDLIAITTLAGIVIGAFQLSGLTSKLPILLTSAAGGNVVLLLVLTAAVSILLDMRLTLGLGATQMVLFGLTVLVSVLTVVPGRAMRLQGGVHLVLLAAFLFLSINP